MATPPPQQQGALAEEEHEAGAVLVEGAALLLHRAHALHDVDQLHLLVRRQLRQRHPLQLLAYPRRHLLREHVLVVVDVAAAVVRRVVVERLGGPVRSPRRGLPGKV